MTRNDWNDVSAIVSTPHRDWINEVASGTHVRCVRALAVRSREHRESVRADARGHIDYTHTRASRNASMCARNVETRTEADLSIRARAPALLKVLDATWGKRGHDPVRRVSTWGALANRRHRRSSRSRESGVSCAAKCKDPEGTAGRRGLVAFMGIHARGQ
jgi:hypothetical protein